MKNQMISFCLPLLLCTSLLFSGCIRRQNPGEETTGIQQEQTNPNKQYSYVTDQSAFLPVILTGYSPAYLRLINRSHTVTENDVPENLVELPSDITTSGKEIYLEERTAQALSAMLEEMKAVGVTDISVTSGYRSFSRQGEIFNVYLQIESSTLSNEAYTCLGSDYIQRYYITKGLSALNLRDAEEVVRSYSAEAGASEHQSGLCVDFFTSTMNELDSSFENTEAFRWLSQNAWKFGFILRFPKGKKDVTGYTYEPWHYRFVGREAATDIFCSGLTLEEYLG